MQLLLRSEVLLAGGGDDEFCVVDETGVVGIDGAEHFLDFLVGHDAAVVLKISLLDFVHGELTVSVLVEGLEHLGQVITLLLAHELRGNESISSLLEGNVRVEFAEVVEGVHGEGLIHLESGELCEPGVLKGLLGGGSVGGRVSEERADKALGVLADSLPDTVLERELSLANALHDLLIGLTVEGRHTGQQDVSNDTCGPDIALLIVVFVEHLGSDVVWRAELLVEISVGVVDERGAEVDDLDLIELLVLLEKNVLGLQVTMDDVSLMAVVDARENLLHQNGCVALAELSTLKDLVEQLATLADPTNKILRSDIMTGNSLSTYSVTR